MLAVTLSLSVTFLLSSTTLEIFSLFGKILIVVFILEIKLLIVDPTMSSSGMKNKYHNITNLYNHKSKIIDIVLLSIIIMITIASLIASLSKSFQDKDWSNFNIIIICFILFMNILTLVDYLKKHKIKVNLENDKNKIGNKILKISVLLLIVTLIGVLIVLIISKATAPKTNTIFYKGNKYYSTAILSPNLKGISERNQSEEFYKAKKIEQLNGKEQSMVWKLDSFPKSKLIVTSKGNRNITSYETWTSQNLKSPKKALQFLAPEFLYCYSNNKKGINPTIRYIDKVNQKKIIEFLNTYLTTPPSHGYMNSESYNTEVSNEIYLFKDKTQSLMMQISLVEKDHKNIYLTVKGDTKREYWLVDSTLISLLK